MLHLREATEQDLPAICTLGEQVQALHHAHWPQVFADPGDPMRHAAHWRKGIAAANAAPGAAPDAEPRAGSEATTWVCELEGQLIGFVTVALAQDSSTLLQPTRYARIGTLGVAPAHRRQGIARSLMQRAQAWAAARGASDLQLHVWDFNADALRLYAALGFEPRLHLLGKPLAP